MDQVYVIRRWDEGGFVKSGQNSRGSIPWVALPTKHDGKGFLRLSIVDPDGSVYGIWALTAAVAAKLTKNQNIPPGVLADEDGPLSVEDIALKIRRTVASVRNAFNVLCSDDIRWLELVDYNDLLAHCYQPASNVLAHRTEQNGQDSTDGTDSTYCPDQSESRSAVKAPASERDFLQVGPDQVQSVWEMFSDEVLKNKTMLNAWFQWQAFAKKKVFTLDDDGVCRRLAKESIEKGKNPVAYFKHHAGNPKRLAAFKGRAK